MNQEHKQNPKVCDESDTSEQCTQVETKTQRKTGNNNKTLTSAESQVFKEGESINPAPLMLTCSTVCAYYVRRHLTQSVKATVISSRVQKKKGGETQRGTLRDVRDGQLERKQRLRSVGWTKRRSAASVSTAKGCRR